MLSHFHFKLTAHLDYMPVNAHSSSVLFAVWKGAEWFILEYAQSSLYKNASF